MNCQRVHEENETHFFTILFLAKDISPKVNPVATARKLNVHKTLKKLPGRLLNVLCAFSLRPLSMENIKDLKFVICEDI